MDSSRGLLKERNLRRDRRVSICVEDRETTRADIEALAERYVGPEQAARMKGGRDA